MTGHFGGKVTVIPQPNRGNPEEAKDQSKSFAELLGSLLTHTSDLVRTEIALVGVELRQLLRSYRSAASFIVIAGALGLLAMMSLVAAAIIALAPQTGAALASLTVGLVLAAVALFLAVRGFRRFE